MRGWAAGMASSRRGVARERHPSSDRASPGHLLPQGEKDRSCGPGLFRHAAVYGPAFAWDPSDLRQADAAGTGGDGAAALAVASDRRLAALKFRRQFPLGRFIADFVCFERRLIVEADGPTHETAEGGEADALRDAELRGLGYRVLRFRNDDIMDDPPSVLSAVVDAACERPLIRPGSARPPSPARGEG